MTQRLYTLFLSSLGRFRDLKSIKFGLKMVHNPCRCKSFYALLVTLAPVLFIKDFKAVWMEVFTTQHIYHLK